MGKRDFTGHDFRVEDCGDYVLMRWTGPTNDPPLLDRGTAEQLRDWITDWLRT